MASGFTFGNLKKTEEPTINLKIQELDLELHQLREHQKKVEDLIFLTLKEMKEIQKNCNHHFEEKRAGRYIHMECVKCLKYQ